MASDLDDDQRWKLQQLRYYREMVTKLMQMLEPEPKPTEEELRLLALPEAEFDAYLDTLYNEINTLARVVRADREVFEMELADLRRAERAAKRRGWRVVRDGDRWQLLDGNRLDGHRMLLDGNRVLLTASTAEEIIRHCQQQARPKARPKGHRRRVLIEEC